MLQPLERPLDVEGTTLAASFCHRLTELLKILANLLDPWSYGPNAASTFFVIAVTKAWDINMVLQSF